MNRLYTLLILMVAFAACKKEEAQRPQPAAPQPVPYLVKRTYWDDAVQRQSVLDTFSVNSNGDLVAVGVYKTPKSGPYMLDKFQYSSNGNIVQAEGYMQSDNWITFRYEYDEHNNIIKRRQVGNGLDIEIVTYGYDAYNRLITEEYKSAFTGGVTLTRTYTYSNTGTLNPASLKEAYAGSTVMEYVYSYDNKPSPFSTLPKIVYYMMDNAELGVNNILNTTITTQGTSNTNTYTYNADNLPYNKSNSQAGEYKYYYGTK